MKNPFKSKKRTSVEKVKERITESKIVKFTYLQTLAINNKLTTARKIAGETEATTQENNNDSFTRNRAAKIEDAVNQAIDPIGILPGGLPGIGGKRTSKNVKQTIKDSGWSVTKVWRQPQFDIIRYAIGIKELTVAQFTYEPVSEFISIPWASPKEIIKVVLNVDQFIPKVFPPGVYTEFYVKPNIENYDWIRINPLGTPTVFKEDGTIVPRIVNFNVEKPISSRLEDNYIYTEEPVREILFRAILKRPDALEGTTATADGYSPILKSYRLLMTPRNGL